MCGTIGDLREPGESSDRVAPDTRIESAPNTAKPKLGRFLKHLRSGAKQALLGLSYHCGGPRIWDLLHRRRIKLLVYHGVPLRAATDGITNLYGYNITADEFERHVTYLKRRCHVMRLDDALAGRGMSRTKINVVLTFDDGYENNYTNAFRILARTETPAVFALATAFVRRREPLWNDVVEYAVSRSPRRAVVLSWEGDRHEWSFAESSGRVELYKWLLRACTRIDQERREELIDTALRALETPGVPEAMLDIDDYRPLTPDQISEMAASGLAEFASHSVHHFLLTRLDADRRKTELTESKRDVEALTGRPCTTFCVPGGQYDAAVVEEAFEAGYARVLTSDGGSASPGQRLIGRSGVFHNTGQLRFADAVHGPAAEMIAWTHCVRRALKDRISSGG